MLHLASYTLIKLSPLLQSSCNSLHTCTFAKTVKISITKNKQKIQHDILLYFALQGKVGLLQLGSFTHTGISAINFVDIMLSQLENHNNRIKIVISQNYPLKYDVLGMNTYVCSQADLLNMTHAHPLL